MTSDRPTTPRDPQHRLPINDLKRHRISMGDAIDTAMREALDSGWYVLGPRVEAFESAFAAACGTEWVVGVANGTDALEIALRALEVSRGDEVITVANAGGYSSVAILLTGATPVYVDVDRETLLIDPDLLDAAIGPRTAALVVTHLYGRVAPVDRIVALASARGLPVIEDCAQAHGARLEHRMAGSVGTLACFSFYPTKNLGAFGDGGAIVGSDSELMARVRRLRQYGWNRKYETGMAGGRNSRLDELQAALLSAQLPLLPRWNQRRSEIGHAYQVAIQHPIVRVLPFHEGDVIHLAVMEVREQRASLQHHLREQGIDTDIHYPYPDYRFHQPETQLGNTDRACRSVLTVPCFPEMTDAETSSVIEAVNSWRP